MLTTIRYQAAATLTPSPAHGRQQATDECGNVATTSCAQLITLEDVTAPDWGNSILYTYAACEDLLDPEDPTLVPIEATDNCSDVTYSIVSDAVVWRMPRNL